MNSAGAQKEGPTKPRSRVYRACFLFGDEGLSNPKPETLNPKP